MNSTTRINARNNYQEELIEQKLKQFEETTDYAIIQHYGQRICGPPREWNQPAPTNGSEIFVGRLPQAVMEDELFEIFSRVGKIYQIRLMVNFVGLNRGFGFIMYESPEHAKMAVQQLNNYLIRPNRQISVRKSVDNRRLYVGGIMKHKTKEEIKKAMECYVNELNDIIMYPPPYAPNQQAQNRGYVFAEFKNHRAATIARRLLGAGGVRLWIDSPSALSVPIRMRRELQMLREGAPPELNTSDNPALSSV
ncbi:hypothetical protein ILUMI_27116 [Ignelater luminosus]|uniref:RRM domain-containing protein n=1 Tax=Ignelater luminosus TaxID=2038154 RepID=A0A8K0C6U1_IGNLU|nr:hypothetical protein ILUMI_27116 [Ignelater luminosus]